MKASVWTKYGSPDGLQLQEVARPVPQEHEVLIKIRAASVTAADCELRAFKGFSVLWLPLRIYIGLLRPTRVRILGQELAGDIEAIGPSVTRFKVGDAVLAWSALRLGSHAEYVCLNENAMMTLKPERLTYAEAAVISVGGFEAWQYLQGNVRAGQAVLIIGAGGSIGTFAIQIAKHLGAEVTAVDSTEKLDFLRSLGADHVLDYTREDFTKSGQTYDVIFDAPGKSSHARCKKLLKPTGQFLSANPGLLDQLRTLGKVLTRRKQAAPENTNRRRENFLSLIELAAAGTIRSVIDRTYPLEQAAAAHHYVESGQKKGHIVLVME